MCLLLKPVNENLKSTVDAVVNVAVAGADVAAIIALAAVAVGAAPVATSKSKCRIMLKTAELRFNWNENWKDGLIFRFLESKIEGWDQFQKELTLLQS